MKEVSELTAPEFINPLKAVKTQLTNPLKSDLQIFKKPMPNKPDYKNRNKGGK